MRPKHVFFRGIALGLLTALAFMVLMSHGVFQAQPAGHEPAVSFAREDMRH